MSEGRPTIQDAIDHDLSIMEERKRAFMVAFGSPAGQLVLEDLGRFCRAQASCFHEDPRIHAALEGRREVWLRIQDYLNLPARKLFERKVDPKYVAMLRQQEEDDLSDLYGPKESLQ